jgi:hypothetical protein
MQIHATVTDRRYRQRPTDAPELVLGERRWFVATIQNGVVQIRRVRPASVEADNQAFAPRVNLHTLHPGDFHQNGPEFPQALVTVFAFRRDLDFLENGPVGVLQIMRIGGIKVLRV